jgi:hypothetical protein
MADSGLAEKDLLTGAKNAAFFHDRVENAKQVEVQSAERRGHEIGIARTTILCRSGDRVWGAWGVDLRRDGRNVTPKAKCRSTTGPWAT